jgi:hypothetical protein
MDRIDIGAVRERVRAWMTAHPDGTPDQMAADLKGEYGEFADDMAIVLRGFMARFQDHPEELASTVPAARALTAAPRPPDPDRSRRAAGTSPGDGPGSPGHAATLVRRQPTRPNHPIPAPQGASST